MNVVVLFDVDNTLLDNDRVAADLRRHLDAEVGGSAAAATGSCSRSSAPSSAMPTTSARSSATATSTRATSACSPSRTSSSIYPFANRLFPGSLDAVDHAATLGTAAILTTATSSFSRARSALRSLRRVRGACSSTSTRSTSSRTWRRAYPADHYVLVDDKVRILAAVKEVWGSRVTTVWPRQGHYALDVADVARYPVPDRHARADRRLRRPARRRAGRRRGTLTVPDTRRAGDAGPSVGREGEKRSRRCRAGARSRPSAVRR